MLAAGWDASSLTERPAHKFIWDSLSRIEDCVIGENEMVRRFHGDTRMLTKALARRGTRV